MNSNQLTLFAEEIPVSQAQKRAWKEARQITAISGRKCFASYGPYTQLSSLTKMLMERLPTASLTGRLMTWKVKATPAKRMYFQLRPSAHFIAGIEFGLSRLDNPSKKTSKKHQKKFANLSSQLIYGLLMPTPTLNDSKNSTMPPSQAYCRKGYQGTLVSALLHMGISPGTLLNPALFECFMGYPKGWTTPKEMQE